MTAPVLVDRDAHVAVVTLNRPHKHNALNLEMLEALTDAGRSLGADRRVRAVVLCGAGDTFCAGIDTSILTATGIAAAGAGRMQPMSDSPANFFQRAALVWQELPVPVIAAIDGVAFGGGLQIAMGADIRLAAEAARFSVMEIRWGIVPDMGITNSMRHVMPLDRLKELVFTGRIVTAPEAKALGMVTAMSAEPVAAAHRLAMDIAGHSPDAVRAAKALLNEGYNEDRAAALRREANTQQALMGTRNQLEAVLANSEKREPRFEDAAD